MNDYRTETTGGTGFCGVLAILFITLKLIGIIAWPWKWVLAPLWVPMLTGILVIVAAHLIARKR